METLDDPFPWQRGMEREPEDPQEELEADKEDECRYRSMRDGDHLLGVPFECNLCCFWSVCHQDPIWGNPKDISTLVCVQRVNLDVFWAREPSTVKGNLSRMQQDYGEATALTIMIDILPTFGNPYLSNRVRMKVDIIILTATLREGVNTPNIQWDTAGRP